MDIQSRRIILKLVRDALTTAMRQDRQATADHAATQTGHRIWNEYTPEDGIGGISQNPYNIESAKERMEQTRKHHKVMQAAYDHAVDTFVLEIPND